MRFRFGIHLTALRFRPAAEAATKSALAARSSSSVLSKVRWPPSTRSTLFSNLLYLRKFTRESAVYCSMVYDLMASEVLCLACRSTKDENVLGDRWPPFRPVGYYFIGNGIVHEDKYYLWHQNLQTKINFRFIKLERAYSQNSRASSITTFVLESYSLSIRERCQAALTPVMPLPITHTSAFSVNWPLLPSSASGLSSGEASQKDLVAFWVGRAIGDKGHEWEISPPSLNICCERECALGCRLSRQ